MNPRVIESAVEAVDLYKQPHATAILRQDGKPVVVVHVSARKSFGDTIFVVEALTPSGKTLKRDEDVYPCPDLDGIKEFGLTAMLEAILDGRLEVTE